MSSLLTTASPWINDEPSAMKKRPSTMRKPIKKPAYISQYGEAEEYSNMEQDNSSETLPNMTENFQELQPSTIQQTQQDTNQRNDKIHHLLNKMTLTTDDAGNKLANFTPPPNPVLNVKKPDNALSPNDLLPKINQQSMISENGMHQNTYSANDATLGIYSNYKQSYEPSNISHKPYYAKMGLGNANEGSIDNRLLEKINYMVHLLEEQQNEKTENITEEFILYTFLGIFIIFVVDSFARAGKYVR